MLSVVLTKLLTLKMLVLRPHLNPSELAFSRGLFQNIYLVVLGVEPRASYKLDIPTPRNVIVSFLLQECRRNKR